MDHIGMDVHKKESQLCILAEGGKLIERGSKAQVAGAPRKGSARRA